MSEIRETRSLYCTLTQAELDSKRDELAQTIVAYDRAEQAKKDAAAEAKSELDEIRGKQHALSLEITTRKELRAVDVLVREDPIRGVVTTMRCDTGEIIHERVMTADERQLDMPIPLRPTDKARIKRKAETLLGPDVDVDVK